MANLFEFTLPEPKEFTKKQTESYYQKILKANPNITLEQSLKFSKEMLTIFQKMMCQVVYYYPVTNISIEYIHEEGHAFKVRLPEGCPGKLKGINALSFSVNAFDNNELERRYNQMDYNVSVVLNDKDHKIYYDPGNGFNYLKIINHPSFNENMKLVFEELDKVMSQTKVSQNKEFISNIVDDALSKPFYKSL